MAAVYNSSLKRWTTTSDTLDTEITLSAGDSIDIHGDHTFEFTQSNTALIEDLWVGNINRTFLLRNTSTTTPIFQRFGFSSGSVLTFQGVYDVQGDFIELGTSDGTASQTFSLPTDSNGDKYEQIACVLVGTSEESYLNVSSFSNLYSDRRGMAFTHDTVNNEITFGDGTNGMIPPLGDVIKIYNIQLQFNYARINCFSGVIKWDKCLIHKLDFSNGGTVNFGKIGIYNSEQTFGFNDFETNTSEKIDICGEPSNRIRVALGNGTHGDLHVFTENSVDVSVVFDYRQKYTINHITLNSLEQTNTVDSRLRLHLNNGSRVEEAYVFSGQEGCFRYYQGTDGSVGHLYYSTRARRDHTGALRAIWSSGSYLGPASVNVDIENITLYGNETQPVLTRFAQLDTGENVIMRNLIDSSSSQYTRFFEIQPSASCTIENFDIYGTCVDANNVLNFSNLVGKVIARNIKFHNEDNVSLRAGRFMEVDNLWIIGNTASCGYGTRSITTRNVNTGDVGHIGLQPFYQEGNAATSIIQGDSSNYLFTTHNFYLSDTTTQIQTESRVIGGVISITSFVVNGGNTANFEILFDMKTLRGDYSGSYQTMNLANLQSAFSSLSGYDSDEGFFIKYRVRRSSGSQTDTISTIVIGCNFDASFSASAPVEDMTVNVTGIQTGDYIYVEDNANNQFIYKQSTGLSDSFIVPGFNDGQTWNYVIARPGYGVFKGSFDVSPGQTLPIAVTFNQLKRAGGETMYTGTDNSNITITFDLNTPLALIRISDASVTPQQVFDKFERALVTSTGMAWHSQQGGVITHDDLSGVGRILFMQDDIKVIRDQLGDVNAAVAGYIQSTQGTPIDGTNGNVGYIGGLNAKIDEMHTRLNLNQNTPLTHSDDDSVISCDDWTLTATDNGDGTYTVNKT